MISTKNLNLIEIGLVEKVVWQDEDHFTQTFAKERRYTLAKEESMEYIDVFTNSSYPKNPYQYTSGEECVFSAQKIITPKKFITKSEAVYIVQNMNPSYLPEKPKKLSKKLGK